MMYLVPTIALSNVVQLWTDLKEFITNGSLILDGFFEVLPAPVSTLAALFTSISIIYLVVGRN